MSNRRRLDPAHNLVDDEPASGPAIVGLGRTQQMQTKAEGSKAHLIKRMIIQNQQRVRRQRFRFDTIDASLILKSDILLIAIQFLVSIIYLGSWLTFLLVRIPRVIWGLLMVKYKTNVFRSSRGVCLMKTDLILRIVTVLFYVGIALGFSVQLPAEFCALIGSQPDNFDSCKWQVFGFRLIFILISLPMEALTLTVVYRHATDMIFKIELRQLTGAAEFELDGKRSNKTNIGYLMDPEIALNRGNVYVGNTGGSYAASMQMSELEGQSQRHATPGRSSLAPDSSRLEMSERRMLENQESVRHDDGTFLPAIDMPGPRHSQRLDFEFGNESDGTDDNEGEEANDKIEEIYRQQMDAAREASLIDGPPNTREGSRAILRHHQQRENFDDEADQDEEEDDGEYDDEDAEEMNDKAQLADNNLLIDDSEAKVAPAPGGVKRHAFISSTGFDGFAADQNDVTDQNAGVTAFHMTRAQNHSNATSGAIEPLEEDDDATEFI